MLKRLMRRWRGDAVADAAPVEALPLPTLAADVQAIGLSTLEWCGRRSERRAMYVSIDPHALDLARSRHPQQVAQTIAAAERVLRHDFELLGSGPFVPRDPDRPARNGYEPIDWYLDPVRRLRFPTGIHHKKWNLFEMRPDNADVKYPWELGRCQHWAVLGQAYRLTGDDRFAVEIANQLDDFVEANPTGVGVNWTCTMDVGLRAVSWAIGLELVQGTAILDSAFWQRANAALFDHGVFIRNNLENTYEVTSNHFLSNLLGLQFIAAGFADLTHGREWGAFARDAIEREMSVQVLPDGADYESSIPYHRLVAELFLGAARLADHMNEPMSAAYRSRVRDMVAYLAAVTRPDGLMPQLGDADDGRLHIVGGYASVSPQDPRHLFGPAAAMFDEPSWQVLGGPAAEWEALWWGLDATVVPQSPWTLEQARMFPQAGVAVAQSAARDYLLVSNGIVGTNGFGNHKHNDQLSFEYHRAGVPLIVDPGSYVYTSDFDARNRFRSTSSHNTIEIDGVEQNDMRKDWLFRLFETSKAETVSFDDRPDTVEYHGRHHGYARLDQPVVHDRIFRFSKSSGDLTIVDHLTGSGRHEARWHFHLAPGVSADRGADGRVTLAASGHQWTLRVPPDLTVSIVAAAYSPSYGVTQRCLAIDASATVVLDPAVGAGERSWEFAITP